MNRDLTTGPIRRSLILFSLPLIAGNLLQQLYNIVDTLIVGQFLGSVALAAVGSAFSLMILLNSLVLGLCMGSGVVFSQLYGEGALDAMKTAMVNAFGAIALFSLLLEGVSYALLPQLLRLLRVPQEAVHDLSDYLLVIFSGIFFSFLYHFFAVALRSVGNSLASLLFSLLSTLLNIALDLLFVLSFHWGVAGAALATVIAQAVSALGLVAYAVFRLPVLRVNRRHMRFSAPLLRRIGSVSVLTSLQQSIMNFGILLIQSLVNSFGISVMAAFAAGVKIDAFAYSPAQDFANGFATFVAQNAGAGKKDRLMQGIRDAALLSLSLCAAVSVLVALFARPLLTLFIDPSQEEILQIGMHYLRTEGV